MAKYKSTIQLHEESNYTRQLIFQYSFIIIDTVAKASNIWIDEWDR